MFLYASVEILCGILAVAYLDVSKRSPSQQSYQRSSNEIWPEAISQRRNTPSETRSPHYIGWFLKLASITLAQEVYFYSSHDQNGGKNP